MTGFCTALLSNFIWNRRWTFTAARRHSRRRQALRFIIVSGAAFALALVALQMLVGVIGLAEMPGRY
jgi:putative flippase GtrA